MRKFIGFMTVAMSLSSVASTGQSQKFIYDGSQKSVQMNFKTTKTHTEYKTENVPSTCYRQEVVGYSTMCSNQASVGLRDPRFPGPGPVGPHSGYPYPGYGYPGGGYGNRFPSTCWQTPIYQTIPYSCIQTVSTPFEVKDYDVEGNVLLDVTKVNSDLVTTETFTVTMVGDTLSVDVKGPNKFLVVLKKNDVRGNVNGGTRYIDGLLAIELIEAAPVLKSFSMNNIELYNDVLTFNIGPVNKPEYLGFSLYITKQRVLASDPVLFDRTLNESEVTLKASAAGSVVTVDMNKAGIQLPSGKFEITAKAFVTAGGKVINAAAFGTDKMEASRTLIYKIR
jgi:hypothetical protein